MPNKSVEPVRAAAAPPIVGIGASAGGLEALTALVGAIPADSGLAYVVVQHLPPQPPTILTQLLQGHTALPISEIVDGAVPQPDTIWVTPADRDVEMRDGALRLVPRTGEVPHLSVDRFFRSLAEAAEENCAAVVLSGSGSDGTTGLRAIKAAGGVTVAQSSETAAFVSMPQSASDSGDVDFVLPPRRIPGHLSDIFAHRDARIAGGKAGARFDDATLEAALPRILRIIAEREGHDFSGYKPGTLLRRLRRRLALTQSPSLDAFEDMLRRDEGERIALIQDFLIGVTRFFRDPGASDRLEELVLPRILDLDAPALRVWVPGCATGEEAYSLAIQLTEAMQARGDARPLQIFGSDLDAAALRFARRGRYPEGALQNVDEARRERFFLRRDGQFEVIQPLREALVFSPHNVLSDPPFSRIQMVSCRNLMIYIGQVAQERLLARLHYALMPGGVLHLGPSESVSEEGARLFSTLDVGARLFLRRETAADTYSPLQQSGGDPGAALRHRASQVNTPIAGTPPQAAPGGALREAAQDFEARLDGYVLGRWSLPYIAVSSDDRVLSYAANAGAMIRPAKGPPSSLLDQILARELRLPVRTLLAAVRRSGMSTSQTDLVLREGEAERLVDLTAEPLPFGDGAALIVMREVRLQSAEGLTAARATPRDQTVETLEEDLALTRRKLAAVQADYDASEQDLRSANEELLSMNEELRLSNEELETSREELQSINEELVTINAELSENNRQLGEANSDLRNVFDSTDIATIFIDRRMRLRRYTRAATAILRMEPTDIGRPVADLAWHVDYTTLEEDAPEVTRLLQTVEREVTDGTRTYMLRIRPYRADDERLDGCVLTFVDVTERQRFEQDLRESEARLAIAPRAGELGVYDFDPENDRLTWSDKTRELWGFPDGPIHIDAALGQILDEDRPAVAEAIEASFDPEGDGAYFSAYRIRNARDERVIWIEARGRVIRAPGAAPRLVGTLRDVTERKQAERRLWGFVESAPVSLAMFDSQDTALAASERWRREWAGAPDATPVRPADWEALRAAALRGETLEIDRQPLAPADAGEVTRWVRGRIGPWRDAQGAVGGYLLHYEDVTDLARAEADLRSQAERLELAYMAAGIGAWDWDAASDKAIWSEQMFTLLGAPRDMQPGAEAFFRFVHPEDRPGLTERFEEAFHRTGNYNETFRVIRGDGEERHFVGIGRVTRDAAGTPVGMIGINADDTERQKGEAQRQLLVDELNHRVKNTLATIQSIANHTARRAPDIESFTDTFLERLEAIARAHEILVGEADANPTLHDLIEGQVAPYVTQNGGNISTQLQLSGPPVRLDTQTGHALALVLHELTTNAAKYGALSREGGRIRLGWTVAHLDGVRQLELTWTETGGPPVAAPERRGFGTILIEQSLSYALGGETDIRYDPEGLVALFRVKLK